MTFHRTRWFCSWNSDQKCTQYSARATFCLSESGPCAIISSQTSSKFTGEIVDYIHFMPLLAFRHQYVNYLPFNGQVANYDIMHSLVWPTIRIPLCLGFFHRHSPPTDLPSRHMELSVHQAKIFLHLGSGSRKPKWRNAHGEMPIHYVICTLLINWEKSQL